MCILNLSQYATLTAHCTFVWANHYMNIFTALDTILRTHSITPILEEDDQYHSHHNHNGYNNERIQKSKEKCLASTTCIILIKWSINTATKRYFQ